MNPQIDLRRYNVKDLKSAMEFLNLVEAKLPQVKAVLRKAQLTHQSLRNNNQFLNDKIKAAENAPEIPEGADTNISVSDRLAGKTFVPGPTEQSRLEQMASVQTPETDDPENIPEAVTNPALLPTPPAAPGEIGSLNLSPVNPPEPTALVAPVLPADTQPIDAPDDVDTSSIELTDPSISTSTPAVKPTGDDITGVGDRVAKLQSTEKPLKAQNRSELNETALSLGIEKPEALESNRVVRKAIEAKLAKNAKVN